MLMAVILAVAILCCVDAVTAQVTQAYSFEFDVDGFGPNGGGVTITQDTIGATDGDHSMKFDIVQGATFVGALTAFLPLSIGDPPGVDFVLLDLTLLEQFPSDPPGFVDAGISIFGSSQPDYPGGRQDGLHVQFFDNQVALGDLEAGTHEIRIDLTQATHPLTFELGSFNDIIGTFDSGPNDIIPTGFQIYINKSSTAPWTGYIDDIRVGINISGDFNGDGIWDCSDIDALTAAIAATSTDLAFDMNADGAVTLADITAANVGWLAVGGANNTAATSGNPFLEGDANLDGSVDVSDFNEWNSNKFTAVAAWCGGDFNADGSVDVSDFNLWNGTKFTNASGDFAAVPEPSLCTLWLLAGLAALRLRVS